MSYPPPYPPGPPGQPGPPPWAPYGYGPSPYGGPSPYVAPPYGTPPWGVPPGPWGVPPAPPARRPWTRKRIALVAGSVVLGVGLFVGVVAAAISVGHSQAALGDFSGAPGGAAVPTAPPSDPAGLGDDPGLDGYAQRCHDGLLSACDDLYTLSDPLSDYEYYAMTCGGRVKPLEVGFCTDLDYD